MSGSRVRFAPSPTGSLHLGNARTALFNWVVARASGGAFVLRIEDTDTEREQEGSEEGILRDLSWLGLAWDEGPGAGGSDGPYRQSERLDGYAAAAGRLLESKAAFRCFCAGEAGESGRAAGHRDPCRALTEAESASRAAAGQPSAVRFRVPARAPGGGAVVRFADRIHGEVAVPLAQIPDAVLVRRDLRPTYNFAVVVDDVAMRIDLVLRGDDHLSNTPLQVLLYAALGERPPEFGHLPMVLGPDGERLSKRHGATSVSAWRERGVPGEALVNALALIGWAPAHDRTIVSLDDVVHEFDLSRVSRSAGIFDPVKLEWISAQHIHAMPLPRIAREVGEALVRSGRLEPAALGTAAAWVASVAEFLRPALSHFDQVPALVEPVFHPGGALGDDERKILADPPARTVVEALAAAVANGVADWPAIKAGVQGATGAKGKALFQPIRIAITGRAHGRELDGIVPLVALGHGRLPGAVPSLPERVARTLAEIE
ncbi:MAG TPA: glutamate--tRNA ligase [Candidatus Polarisedimenticolaceae bacterium]|nr:glutamate--tRNA ligase [Candidatus Polarisedimenticolaceae bacterium]